MNLLILGASVRAAAFSALRAGLRPTCGDLFADRDLAAVAPARRVAPEQYPRGLLSLAAEASRSPWIYTGALENHPDLIDEIAANRPLWGNGGAVLRAVRDPFVVFEVLRRAGLPVPSLRSSAEGLPRDGSWLVKPIGSAGGQGVVPLGSNPTDPLLVKPIVPTLSLGRGGSEGPGEGAPPRPWPRAARPHPAAAQRLTPEGEGKKPISRAHGVDESLRSAYYQERIPGRSFSATFIGRSVDARLVGVTRQWLGRPGAPFAYSGSVGPWPVAPEVRARVESLGRTLASAFGLVGLFGVDFILRAGHPWPVEVNPRYTASVEVLELALGRALLAEHAVACGADSLVPKPSLSRERPGVVGKLILFATIRCRYPDEDGWRTSEPADRFALSAMGDVPQQGTIFEPGEPVLTLFAAGPNPASCRARLRRERDDWLRRLTPLP